MLKIYLGLNLIVQYITISRYGEVFIHSQAALRTENESNENEMDEITIQMSLIVKNGFLKRIVAYFYD